MRWGVLCVLLMFVGPGPLQAQRVTDRNSNLWLSHWGDHRLSQHVSVHTEGHLRRGNVGQDRQQLLLRPAVNYHLNDQITFTLGYSYYRNHPYGNYPIRFANWEHHVWQQVQLGQTIGRSRIAHRFRMEERYIAQLKPTSDDPKADIFDTYTYQSRFRYRIWLTLPVGHDKVGPGVFTLNLYDELFLNFGDPLRLDYMQQNRLSALLGYQVSEPLNMMLGYLYQSVQRPGAASGADLVEANSTVHLAVVYNLDLRKKQLPAVH